jgi:hypothetical protein
MDMRLAWDSDEAELERSRLNGVVKPVSHPSAPSVNV